MGTCLQAALARARAGEPVLPLWWTNSAGICRCPKGDACPSPGKHPLTAHGLDDATTDSTTIESWWRQWPDANLGVRTDHVARIDIDLVEVAEELAADTALPLITEIVRTPRGGLHISVAVDAPVPTRTLYLADGRKLGELKAARAYVVAPPSENGARAYVHLSRDEVDPARGEDPLRWFAELLSPFGFELATDQSNGRRDYEGLAGTIHEKEGRHNALTSYAGRLWIKGMASETLAELLTVINRRQCRPPLPEDELSEIVQHFTVRREQRSGDQGESQDLDDNGGTFVAQSVDELLAGQEEPLDPVIGDGGEGAILTTDGKGCVAAPTGIGKTNLLLRGSRSFCEASPFLGYPVPRPRRVLYLALEGSPRALRRRLRKVWDGAGPEARARFYLANVSLNLGEEVDLARLDGVLYTVRPDVLIIDPLRNAHPWDENVSHEMARLTAILDGIIARHHCALIFAHHDRKRPPLVRFDSGTDRVRGSTALTGWLSFCLSVDPDIGIVKDRLVLHWTKTRDAEEPLEPLLVDFDRDTIDFITVEGAALGGKVPDQAILNGVFQAGSCGVRGTDLITGFVQGAGASDRWVRERIRGLVKEGKLLEFVPPEEKKGAKWYKVPGTEPTEEEP